MGIKKIKDQWISSHIILKHSMFQAKQDEEMMELTKPEPEVIPEKPAVSEPKEKEPTPEVANIELQIKVRFSM